jgi:hypothetical protein
MPRAPHDIDQFTRMQRAVIPTRPHTISGWVAKVTETTT